MKVRPYERSHGCSFVCRAASATAYCTGAAPARAPQSRVSKAGSYPIRAARCNGCAVRPHASAKPNDPYRKDTTVNPFKTCWALSAFARFRGLIGRPSEWLGPQGVLVIAPCKSIHTFHMRHAIDVAFANEEGRVLRSCRAVPPHRILTCHGAAFVIERFTPQAPGALPWPQAGSSLGLCCKSPSEGVVCT